MRSIAAAILLSSHVLSLSAQRAPVLTRSVYELEQRQRWLPGDMNPLHVPFDEQRASLMIWNAETDSGGARTLRFLLADTLTLRLDRFGQVQNITVRERRMPPAPPGADSIRRSRMRYLVTTGSLLLPESRLWELSRSFRPAALRAGVRWTEPVRLRASRPDLVQAVTGSRVATLLRDTMIDGRQHWIVRDSARLTWLNEWPATSLTIAGDTRVRQNVTGVRRGLFVYDPEHRLLRTRVDTTLASGFVERTDPDGNVTRTRTRFEQYARLTWRDSLAARLYSEERMAEQRRTGFRIVDVPDERQRLLRAGNAQVIDSMLIAWSTAADPNARVNTLNMLMRYARPDSLLRRRVLDLALQAGDTASAYDIVTRWSYNSALGVDEVQFLLPFLAEPARAARFGRSVDTEYLSLFEPMMLSRTPGSRCQPAACQMLMDQVDAEGDDRLRQLAWSMRVMQDPARWFDTLAAQVRADSSRLLLLKTYKFALGEPATMRRSRSVPAPGEGWRAWLLWVGGPGRPGALSGFIGGDLASAVDFVSKRTGRDFGAEMTAAYQTATEDSAKLVFGVLASTFGKQASAEEIERNLDAGKPLLRELAMSQLLQVMQKAEPADVATQEEIVRQYLAWRFDNGPAWPVDAGPPWSTDGSPVDSTTFVLADSLPPGQLARWAARGRVITQAEWDARSQHEKRDLYTISHVRVMGSFVSINVTHAIFQASAPDERPRLYYTGLSAILRRTSRGWIVVNSSSWIT